MNILLQIGLFIVLYILKMTIILSVISLVLRSSPYCVDRIIYTPFLIPTIYRDHAKSRRELPKDIAFEFLIYFFVILISFCFFAVLIRPLPDANLLLYMLMITFIIELFLTVIHIGVFFFSIIYDPKRYNERIFIEESTEKDKKIFYNTDPFTTEESLQIFREIHFGPIIVSLINYYYNLSMTMIDGAALIRRKVRDFLKAYGTMLFLIPIVLFIFFMARTGEPPEADLDNVGKTVAEQLGIETSLAGAFLVLLLTIYIPILGGLDPDIWYGIERQFNSHNGKCVCQERRTRYRKILRPVMIQVESWRNFEDQMKEAKPT